MIITLTANPSLDRTIELGAPLAHGAVPVSYTHLTLPTNREV